ncbi:porin [Thiomicrospira microaerophila]|uniref:porin n=1 Tax=Thiomicrospira microaerophila TaxID=406020 RepID=UPI0005CAED68|nr:porin [Thiomicrospira microaerophila]
MKKNILAMGIAAAIAAPVAMADAPTVYGQFNIAVDMIDGDMSVGHRNSRLGIKGGEDLGNGLKAVYSIEGTVGQSTDYKTGGASAGTVIDTTGNEIGTYSNRSAGFAFDRNTFAGIAGGFGTVVMGRHDTPLRMIQPNDGFNDSPWAGNNTSVFNGFTGGVSGEDRVNQVLAYISPSFNGIQVAAAFTNTSGDTLTDDMSVSIAYGSKRSGLYAAAAMTSLDAGRDNMRVTVQYNEGGMLGYVMYNDIDSGNPLTSGNSITLGAAYKMGALTPRAKLSMISYDAGANDSAMNMAFGADYAMGKRTALFAEVAMIDSDSRNNPVADETAISVGLKHSF